MSSKTKKPRGQNRILVMAEDYHQLDNTLCQLENSVQKIEMLLINISKRLDKLEEKAALRPPSKTWYTRLTNFFTEKFVGSE